jgi:hypothetical protein
MDGFWRAAELFFVSSCGCGLAREQTDQTTTQMNGKNADWSKPAGQEEFSFRAEKGGGLAAGSHVGKFRQVWVPPAFGRSRPTGGPMTCSNPHGSWHAPPWPAGRSSFRGKVGPTGVGSCHSLREALDTVHLPSGFLDKSFRPRCVVLFRRHTSAVKHVSTHTVCSTGSLTVGHSHDISVGSIHCFGSARPAGRATDGRDITHGQKRRCQMANAAQDRIR